MQKNLDTILVELPERVSEAVASFWSTRKSQTDKQYQLGKSDAGARSAATGGKQMDGFQNMLHQYLKEVGVRTEDIFSNTRVVLPGYYRSTKKWDIVVVSSGRLLVVVELKSQVGPSFGNNFNNRTEEAIGSAADLWTAYREGAFGISEQPWLGYLFLLEDCSNSRSPVKNDEPHFPVFPDFIGASYQRRYEILCKKLMLERQYSATALLLSEANSGTNGEYSEKVEELSIQRFMRSLLTYIVSHYKVSE